MARPVDVAVVIRNRFFERISLDEFGEANVQNGRHLSGQIEQQFVHRTRWQLYAEYQLANFVSCAAERPGKLKRRLAIDQNHQVASWVDAGRGAPWLVVRPLRSSGRQA